MTLYTFSCCLTGLICWGISPLVYRFCSEELSPAAMQALRSVTFFVTGLCAALIGSDAQVWPGFFPVLVLLTGTAIDLGLGDSLNFAAVRRIGAGKSAALANSYPMYSVLGSWLFLNEGLSIWGFCGVIAVVAGLFLVCLFNSKEIHKENTPAVDKKSFTTGLLFGIAAGMCWSTGHVVTRWLFKGTAMSPATIIMWRSVAVLLWAWGTYLPEWYKQRDRMPLFPVFSVRGALICSSGLWILWFPGWCVAHALQMVPASMVSPITGSAPALSALLSRLVFKEPISPLQWLGIFMIVGGGAAVTLL